VCPGLVYRRDVVDRLHIGEPHQTDYWIEARHQVLHQGRAHITARQSLESARLDTNRKSADPGMPKISNAQPLTIPLNIPAYWTPEQAFAVVELLDDLRDRIWAHYAVQLLDQYRDQYGPADTDHTTMQLTIRRSDSPCR
jgi:hypothetical protein